MIRFAINQIKKRAQFFKYCVGGGTAFIVDFSLLYIFTEFAGFWYLWSATLSFTIAVFVNYLIQKFWTFKSKDKAGFRQFFIFLAVQVVGLFINNTTMYVLVEYVSFWYILAKAVATAIVLIWNFWASKMFVFNPKFINKKPQIIIAADIFPPNIGGPATYAYRLAKYFQEQGDPAQVICYSTFMPRKKKEEFGKNITRISSFLPLPIKYFLYFINLFILCLSIFPKVIYAQGPVASGLPAIIVGTLLGRRVVVKVVGDYSWEQARLHYTTQRSIDDWQKERHYETKNKLLKIKLNIIYFIQRIVVRAADAIVTPSHYLKNLVVGWGADEKKIKVIYNSVDFHFYEIISKTEAKKQIGITGDIILTVDRLVPWKHIDKLIEFMPDFKKINPHFKLVIVGSGSEEKRLKDIIKQLKLEQDVIMVGRLNQNQLRYYYQASTFFIKNSSYEGLSHVILEAMYYKLPIICSNIGGNPELIQDDYNGCLVEYNNREQWRKAIKRLWFNKKVRQRFCSNPIVKMDVFSFEHMIRDTLKVLNQS